jgi:hypothetical protein
MWNVISLVCVIWCATLANIQTLTAVNQLGLLIALFSGWAVFIIAGITIQQLKYPSMLFNKKDVTIEAAFLFALRSDSLGKSITRDLNYVSSHNQAPITTLQLSFPEISMESHENLRSEAI